MAKDIETENFIESSLNKIKALVDVNSIVGNPITTEDGDTIIPIAKVSVGFFSGSGEYKSKKMLKESKIPLTGGIGSGYSINPIGFLVTQKSGSVRFLDIGTRDNYKFIFDSFLNFVKNMKSSSVNTSNEEEKV